VAIKLFLGIFNAEAYLDNNSYVQLPTMHDEHAVKLIHSMDELLFPLCDKNSRLITRYAISDYQKNFLSSIGFDFVSNSQSVDTGQDGNKSLVSLLINNKIKSRFTPFINACTEIIPYADIPEIQTVCDHFSIKSDRPDLDIIKLVNSKIYSHDIHERIGIKRYSTVVTSIEEMEHAAEKMSGKPFLIKYPFGVSGKGNILISSNRIFNRIKSHFKPQIAQGKKLSMLIEPFLDKKTDFSCQIIIGKNGKIEIVSIQKMENVNFAYAGSSSVEKEFYHFLEENQYFEIMYKIGDILFEDGYWGNVCVDSMILSDNTIVPVVEINARKSMGFINYAIENILSRFNLKSYLRFYSVGIRNDFSYENLLDSMITHKIAFKPESGGGIIPLSSNALTINRDADQAGPDETKIFKGRLYISIGAECFDDIYESEYRFRSLLHKNNVQIYN
jgi:hypothetical protein